MKNFWICVFAVASIGVAKAQLDYDDFYDDTNFEDLEAKIDEAISKLNEKTDLENDLKVDEEIQEFKKAAEDNFSDVDEPKDIIDNFDDYQFEDNRDKAGESDEKKDVPSDNDGFDEDGKIEAEDESENKDYDEENRPEFDERNAADRNKDYALLWGDDSIAPLPVPASKEDEAADDNKVMLEETQKLLDELQADAFEEDIKKEIGEVNIKTDDQPNLEQIIDDTKKILADSDATFDNDDAKDENAVDNSDVKNENEINDENVETAADEKDANEKDTVDKAYDDLNADLDKLFATLEKLKKDVSDSNDDGEDLEKALEMADNLFEDDKDDSELVENNQEDDTVDLDKLFQDILSEDDMQLEDSVAEKMEPLINDALNEPNPEDEIVKDAETLNSKLQPILYINDALVDEPKEAESFETNDKTDNADASVEKKQEVKTVPVEDLNSAEIDDIVSQFSELHAKDLDVHSDTFNKDVAAVHLTLKLDEPTIITSPGHPSPYPSDNIVDWVIDGEGMGIELNITEFAVRGAAGDYLLIKPGGIDDSGHDGLLFTYRLNSERRYRFTDVDRMFMRFEAKSGMAFLRGFSISAKMIAPLSEGPEPIPEPEPVVVPPHSTATVTLAVTVPFFKNVKEHFRMLLADMAGYYIRDNNIDPGLNTTIEVTQITSVGLCPMTWPNYENCAAVTFGVSLVYEDDRKEEDRRLNSKDLKNMWRTYANRDPFALALAFMGITEFNRPSSSALTVWLVIAGGVAISMAMLAVVLWRYSCSEDYSRMKSYSDTDSVQNEKRHLDLYPTPHQTLPPLYAESEYKWQEEDTRVDMGGFANRSYARENMYDFESDEEVVSTRDRYTTDV